MKPKYNFFQKHTKFTFFFCLPWIWIFVILAPVLNLLADVLIEVHDFCAKIIGEVKTVYVELYDQAFILEKEKN